MKTYVYIDAFNLYYGCLKGTPFRWLDLRRLCQNLLPHNQVEKIKYFTARVGERADNPGQPIRQQVYLRALGTLSEVEIIYGHYLSHIVSMPRATPAPGGSKYVSVIKTEEKGSDVNLATHLVSDGYEEKYEVAVLVTNDSDLLGPVQLVSQRLRKRVGVLNPQKHPSFVLKNAATFFKQIRPGVLGASQFPDQLEDLNGIFRKPGGW